MAKGKKVLFSVVTVLFTLFFIIGSLLFFNKNKISADANKKGPINSESNIKVSVIIPVYNAEKYLPKCLDSVLNQTLKEIEVICVNDKSPDNCNKILENYAKKDPRILVINHKENKGACAARNSGLNAAKGEYIRFCDADDKIDPKTCEISYKKAKDENADILYDDMPYNKVIKGPVYNNFKWAIWSGVYRTQFLNENNIRFYEPIRQYGDDHVFNLMCIPKAKKIVCIKDKFYNYNRNNPDNSFHNPKEIREFPDRHRMAVQKIREVWSKEGYFKYNEAKVAFLKWAYYSMRCWIINLINKSFVDAIGPDLLKDSVLSLLDKNTRDGIKNMVENSWV